ncbi:MAG: hypothetical protein ACD_5C00327G0001 [uncultured bacterium]|nr:MAG: hypothetical protein ACD_5C00327G0001 [uncultured bacterium]KKQ80364.1 MAG: hypothetical protein UT03_C0026G0002 [Candidatus Moranbacteria bacterium GW2011_GWD2_38_7]
MTWILITIAAYFLGAVTVILDKYLLSSEKISSPPVYAFYVGMLGLGVLMFWPLGFFYSAFVLKIPSNYQLWLSLQSGVFFLAAITTLYFAIKKSEASKVTPVVFSVVPIVTFLAAFSWGIESYASQKIIGIVLLIFGGLFISFDLPLKFNKKKFFGGFYFSLLAGTLLGYSTFLLKLVYDEQNFFNGYVWTRVGAFIGTLGLLFIPHWRRKIIFSLSHGKKKKKENLSVGALFVFNKIMGGSSSALINIAIGIGSVTLVSSLISVQYVFVLLIAIIAGKHLPHIFEERLYFWDWAQKVAAIVVIAGGMFLISA